MVQRIVSMLIVFIVALFVLTVAEEIVLQQGVDGYTGCIDATIGKPQGYNQNSNYGLTNDLSIELRNDKVHRVMKRCLIR